MFKVGEVVRVKKDLVVGEWYEGVEFLDSMNCFLGEEVEIREIKHGAYKAYSKKFKNSWYFAPEMLEPISKAKEYTLIVTDKKVIILDKENKKRGLSECHEEDTFDFSIGAKLAWDRLHGIKEETPKPVEYKLYDCNGVELKEGDRVKCICLDDGDVQNTYIVKDENGILYNSGLISAHIANKNGGKYDKTNTDYNWYIVKVTK